MGYSNQYVLKYHAIRRLPMPYTFRSGMREPVNIANFTATECLLGLWIQSIRASVSDGKYTEEVLATSDNFTTTPPPLGSRV